MKYGTVCSGIEAPTVAWHSLGWRPMWFSEIDGFCNALLEHYYPDVPNLGDMTEVTWDEQADIDVLIGGTPCQSFSVAGLRKGLADPRGNLALVYLGIADALRPRWIIWENVPGVLSSGGGRDFGAFLGALEQLGYGWAYRVLDAQYFGVPQRRRRVFVVGHLGDWRRAAAVLFEPESLSRHPAPGGQARETVAALTANGVGVCGADDNQSQAGRLIEDTLTAKSLDSCGIHGVPKHIIVGFHVGTRIREGLSVRRLTPIECERLQGFPDNYTRIPYRGRPADQCPDTPRYRALGNSMAVPVIRWLGERIAAVDAMGRSRSAGEESHQPR